MGKLFFVVRFILFDYKFGGLLGIAKILDDFYDFRIGHFVSLGRHFVRPVNDLLTNFIIRIVGR